MASLGSDFIKINGVTIPTPATYSQTYTNIEEVNQSEAGTDRVIVTRLLKRSYNFTFQVTDFWRQRLLAYGNTMTATLQIGSENSMTGRFRITGDEMQRNSNMSSTQFYTVRATFNQI